MPGFLDIDCGRAISSESEKSVSLINMLGLKNRFLHDLRNLPDDIREHQNTEDWILIFLEKNHDAIEDENLKRNLSKELLEAIGFEQDSKAVNTILSRSKKFSIFRNHVAPIDVVKRFILDEIKYNGASSTAFALSVDIDTLYVDNEGEDVKRSVQLVKTRINELSQDSQYKVLFHGTDILSADDILSGGIDVCVGSQKRDFSDGEGFYLTDNFELAKNWAFSVTQKPVVLVFTIPKSFLQSSKALNLSGESKESEWKAVVSANRSGILDWKMRKKLKKHDFIEGPHSEVLVREGYSDEENRYRKEIRAPAPNSHQLCVINEDFADDISKYIKTVVRYC